MSKMKCLSKFYRIFLITFTLMGIIVFPQLNSPGLAATTSGILSADETWGGMIILTGDVTVPAGITLTITPGTVVQFTPQEGLELIIEGQVLAEGEEANPIIFTSQSETPLPGDWTWIYFGAGSTGELSFCQIAYANAGIRAKMASPLITHSLLEKNLFGASLSQSNATITQTTIRQNDIGIAADYCQSTITSNQICLNTYEGVILGHASSETCFQNNLIYDNGWHGLLLEYTSLAPVVSNTIYRNGGDGICLRKGSVPKISNNLITHNQGYGISCWQSAWPVIMYNDLWANAERSYYDYDSGSNFTPLPGAGELAEDPLYVNADIPDLHLQTGSLAIDAGDPASPYQQEPLPNGSRINMGAFGNTSEATLSCEPQCTISIAQDIFGIAGDPLVIPVHLETAQGVIGIENLVIRYATTSLAASEVTMTDLGQDWNLVSNLTVPGEIRISTFSPGSIPVVGSGNIFNITFQIIGSAGITTPLRLISVKQVLGEGDGHICTRLIEGKLKILGEMRVSGQVTYYAQGSSPVPDVLLALAGSAETYETRSTQSEMYLFENIPDGLNYILTPSKTGDLGTSIGIYDAILIARQTVGLENFGSWQARAADVNVNTEVDIGDAIAIARYTVGLESLPFPVGKIWDFIPGTRTYAPLLSHQENQNFVGLIYGDVDGNWESAVSQAGGAGGAGVAGVTGTTDATGATGVTGVEGVKPVTAAAEAPACRIFFPADLSGNPGEILDIPLNLAAEKPVLGLSNLVISYNPEVLEIQSIQNTSFSQSLTLITNIDTPGQIRLSAFGTTTVSGEGSLALLRVRVAGQSGDSSSLELIKVDEIVSDGGESITATLQSRLFMVASTLSMPQMTINKEDLIGGSVSVPLSITRVNNLFGLENLIIIYSPSVLGVQSVNTTALTAGFTLVSNLDIPGQIRISLFGVTPYSGEGEILEVRFQIIGSAGDHTSLDLSSINRLAGEGSSSLPVRLTDGSLNIKSNAGTTPPVANAGQDQIIRVDATATGGLVTLDGSGSSDEDGDTLTYTWTWPCDGGGGGGCSASGVNPTVTFPVGTVTAGTVTVTLTVFDGQASDSDTVNISVVRMVEIPLSLGWSSVGPVIDLGSWAAGSYVAADMCQAINQAAGNDICQEIDRLSSGSWEGHICGLLMNNFDISPGYGYLIKTSSPGVWVHEGFDIASPLGIVLHPGWNVISLPLWAEGYFDAQGLIDLINLQALETCCLEVDRFSDGFWQGHIDGLPFNNFFILPGEAYLVKMSKEVTIVVEKR